jgi:prevent-host-death family protein
MLNLDFSPRDIIGLTDMRRNLAEIIEDVETTGSQKVVIRKGRPSVVVISVAEFEDLQNRLLAMELEAGLRQAREEQQRGELLELDELAAKFGLGEADFPDVLQQPTGYAQKVKQKRGSHNVNAKR